MAEDESELRIAVDPTTGRPILVAPQRRLRPLHTRDATLGPCPFCPGEEHQTPPETDREGDDSGWTVRGFPNLYPATPDHEVIVEGAAHETQPGRVPKAVWVDAFAVYRRRIEALESRPSVRCAFLFKNIGREAGASIAHNHSQLIGLPMVPPRLELLVERTRENCTFCIEVEKAAGEHRMIAETRHFALLCPAAPKIPYETWLLPKRHDADFLAPSPEEAEDLAGIAARAFAAIDRAFDGPAFNVYLHRVRHEELHWHMELQPRTNYLAGLELGGDMYINSISGVEAAARLKDHV